MKIIIKSIMNRAYNSIRKLKRFTDNKLLEGLNPLKKKNIITFMNFRVIYQTF